MDKKRGALNVGISILSRAVLLVAAVYVRRLLIRYVGNEVNGLSALYTSIIGILAVAELGIGSAIIFSMYGPIIAGEKRRVAALYCVYKRLYRIVGGVIFLFGLVVMPFLPFFISDYRLLDVNVYFTFFLMLVSVVLSYLYGAKTALIIAHKDNYIVTGILTVAGLLRYLLQIGAILLLSSFEAYLCCQIIETLIVWILTEVVVRRRHGGIISIREAVSDADRTEIIRNVKAMFMHKSATALVKTIDDTIISAFIGVVVLGKYSNYVYVASVLAGLASLFFTPVTSVIGHLCAEGDQEQTGKYFDRFYCLNFALGLVFFLGYYAVIDNVIGLFFDSGLELARTAVFVITLNQFTQYMRNAVLLFRNASGTFYYDRWKAVVEAAANLGLSLLFVIVFPEDLKMIGVIVATIITTLLICYTVEPYVIFRHVFDRSPVKFYIRNYAYVALFVVCIFITGRLIRPCPDPLTGLLVNGLISVGVASAALASLAGLHWCRRKLVPDPIKKV